MTPVSVAIVTYKRPQLLQRCLASLCRQTMIPKNIIVIDNDPLQSGKPIWQHFVGVCAVQYITEPTRGAPACRNRAMALCKTRYLGFIDDDCIADSKWLQTGISALKLHNSAYVVGQSLLLNKKSIIAQTQYSYYHEWFQTIADEKLSTIKPDGLDTKNAILNLNYIQKYHKTFDTIFTLKSTSGDEDVDFGRQLAQIGIRGTYAAGMIVYHRETESLHGMLHKAINRGRLHFLLQRKWEHVSLPITTAEAVSGLLQEFRRVMRLGKLWCRWMVSFFAKKRNSRTPFLLLQFLQELYDVFHKLGYAQQRLLSLRKEK